MTRALVQAYVEAKVATLAGILRVESFEPEPDIPGTDLPLCVVELGQSASEQITFNTTSGFRHDTYDVTMTLYLGLPSMPKASANEQAAPFSELFVTAFLPDPKLGGNCWDSVWNKPTDNLKGGAYKQLGEHAKIQFTLTVTEQTTMGG